MTIFFVDLRKLSSHRSLNRIWQAQVQRALRETRRNIRDDDDESSGPQWKTIIKNQSDKRPDQSQSHHQHADESKSNHWGRREHSERNKRDQREPHDDWSHRQPFDQQLDSRCADHLPTTTAAIVAARSKHESESRTTSDERNQATQWTADNR